MPTAVLLSGGLDSAVLLADEAARGETQPIYVGAGLAWESAERAIIARLLESDPLRGLTRPLVSLAVDMRDLGVAHQVLHRGRPESPRRQDRPDRRRVVPQDGLAHDFGIALVRDAVARLGLKAKATPAFRESISRTLSLGLAHTLTVDAPYATSSKADVISKGIVLGVPFEHTLSCMKPAGGRHCGTCSKCRERHDAFLEAGVTDPTTYESLQFVR